MDVDCQGNNSGANCMKLINQLDKVTSSKAEKSMLLVHVQNLARACTFLSSGIEKSVALVAAEEMVVIHFHSKTHMNHELL